VRISATVSAAMRNVHPGRLRQRHRALKPARCQRRSVSGWTTRSTFLHVGVMAASATSTIRSSRVTRGRATDRCSTVSWCRSKAISVSNDRRERNRSTTAAARTVTMANIVREHSAVPSAFSADRRSSQDGTWTRLGPAGDARFPRDHFTRPRWFTRPSRRPGISGPHG